MFAIKERIDQKLIISFQIYSINWITVRRASELSSGMEFVVRSDSVPAFGLKVFRDWVDDTLM